MNESEMAKFRATMGQVPTCVTVVTATVDDQPHAMVIGSFVSVSLEPPMAGFFCTSTSYVWQQLQQAETLGVNVLGSHQVDVSNACMRDASERFDGIDWTEDGGAPRIADTTAWIRMTLSEVVDTGDHQFALCNVVDMDIPEQPREPVVFYGSAYRNLEALDDLAR